MKDSGDHGNDKNPTSYGWKEQIKEYVHSMKWRNKVVIFEDNVVINPDLTRLLRIIKEDLSDYDRADERYSEDSSNEISYFISDEYKEDLIRVTCTFLNYYSKDSLDLSFFGSSLDDAMIQYLINQYRANLLMKMNRANLGRLHVIVEEEGER